MSQEPGYMLDPRAFTEILKIAVKHGIQAEKNRMAKVARPIGKPRKNVPDRVTIETVNLHGGWTPEELMNEVYQVKGALDMSMQQAGMKAEEANPLLVDPTGRPLVLG